MVATAEKLEKPLDQLTSQEIAEIDECFGDGEDLVKLLKDQGEK